MNAGMGHLQISPSSPYESQNVSRVSLVSTLQQQRGITAEARSNGTSPLSPLGGPRSSVSRAHVTPRRAPVINPNPRSVSGMPDPMAAAPTKGYAWAFPAEGDPEERRASSSGDSSVGRSLPSRRNSFAASVNSSIFTQDSVMPAGQKRFDEADVSTHHHSMQHRSVTNLQGGDHTPNTSSGNYSRTPELRVSHKMAERKRRSEMKSLFDELNGILPNSPGSKSSKWEILTKSIEHIRNLQRHIDGSRADGARLRQDQEYMRRCHEENEQLKAEIQTLWQQARRLDPNNSMVCGNMTSVLAQQHNQTPHNQGPPGNVLPPLQPQTSWGPAAPAAPMQGVEFAGARSFEHR